MKCRPGCSDCCGPVPFSKEEWGRIADKRKATGITCPYSSKDGCAIYSQRPIVCRIFGTVPGLPCPHGYMPDNPLSGDEENNIIDKYMNMPDIALRGPPRDL